MSVACALETQIPEPQDIQRAVTQGTLGYNPDMVTLQPDGHSQGPSWNCRRIGDLSNDYFYVSHPIRLGELVPLHAGQALKVKYFDGLYFNEHNAYVEKVSYSPEPHILIQRVKNKHARKQTIRQARRVPCNFPVAVQCGAGCEMNAIMTDVSMGGGMLLLEEPLSERLENINLIIDIPYKQNYNQISVQADIRRRSTNKLGDHAVHSVAVQFQGLDGFSDLVLNNYINSLLLLDNKRVESL